MDDRNEKIDLPLHDISHVENAFAQANQSEAFAKIKGEYQRVINELVTEPLTITLYKDAFDRAIRDVSRSTKETHKTIAIFLRDVVSRARNNLGKRQFELGDALREYQDTGKLEAKDHSPYLPPNTNERRDEEEEVVEIEETIETDNKEEEQTTAVIPVDSNEQEHTDSQKFSFKDVNKVTAGTALLATAAGVGLLATSSKTEREQDPETGQQKETKKPNWFKRILGVGVLIAAVAIGIQAAKGKSFAEMELFRRANKQPDTGLSK